MDHSTFGEAAASGESSTAALVNLLDVSDDADLAILADYLTDDGKGRLMLDADAREQLAQANANGVFDRSDRRLIAKEIRAFGGNTLVNAVRGEGVDYDELVRDVADHLNVAYHKAAGVERIESAILQKLFADTLENMTEEERAEALREMNLGDLVGLGPGAVAAAIAAGRMGGFATYKIAVRLAHAIAKALLGRGLPFGAGAIIGRGLNLFLGPVGIVLTALWSLADLASPAYRVTVPCVVHIAYLRQKVLMRANSTTCPACSTVNAKLAKFCSECGTGLT
ncbi:ubiquinol-cytochrome C chaperone family protein [Burkholderia cepacia]|uniref:ubiquinol-cytochrome C chaperone family protein n=1 Tax=Burkholderia cepacia TaxID=292 RepID=UPI003A4E66B3